MTERLSFAEQLQVNWEQGKRVCLELTGSQRKLLDHYPTAIEAAVQSVGACRIDTAYFERDPKGVLDLQNLILNIHMRFPNLPVIGDMNRLSPDVSANELYAQQAFRQYQFDAVTLHPWLGPETYIPYLQHSGKGVLVVCKAPQGTPFDNLDIVLSWPATSKALSGNEGDAIIKKCGSLGTLRQHQLAAFRLGTLNNPNLAIATSEVNSRRLTTTRALFGEGPIFLTGLTGKEENLQKILRAAVNSTGQGFFISIPEEKLSDSLAKSP